MYSMVILTLWWTGIAVELAILVRGVQRRTLRKFPYFFFYIASVLFSDFSLYVLHLTNPAAYPIWAARAELVNIVLGYGIILEIFRHVLARYPGIDRLAQVAGLIVFAAILCLAAFHPTASTVFSDARTQKAVTERDFLAVQMIFLLAATGIIRYYGLETGKNIRGIIAGYGIWLGASVITLELMAYLGPSFNAVWVVFQPFCYLLSLVLWLRAMWTYSPAPALDSDFAYVHDYETLAEKTVGIAGEVRAHLGRMAR